MTGSAPSGIGSAEADEKTAEDDRDKSFEWNQNAGHVNTSRGASPEKS